MPSSDLPVYIAASYVDARDGMVMPCRYEDIQVGESAELLLLSNTADFSSFKVRYIISLLLGV